MKVEQMFSPKEMRDLAISVLVIAFIFAYVYNGRNVATTILTYPVFIVIVIFSFLAHELAHRYVGRKFGCVAYYEMSPLNLAFSFIASVVTGFVLLVPGHVTIKPFRFGRWGYRVAHLTMTEIGLISFVGPLTNLALGLFFRLFGNISSVFYILSYINAWLAFFNLIPVKPLDGAKILYWKHEAWFASMAISFLLVLTFVIQSI